MPELTIAELVSMEPREYVGEIKSRLRDDEAWAVLLSPELMARTRWALGRIISSIDDQKARILGAGGGDATWLKRVDSLRRYAKTRLDRIAPEDEAYALSSSKESKAWRSFSAQLARALVDGDPTALDRVRPPYADMSVLEWLEARDNKRGARR